MCCALRKVSIHQRAPLDADGQGTPYAVYGYGAQVAEIEVDLQLGTVKVIRITAAHDLGRVINPLLAAGQIEGGVTQGWYGADGGIYPRSH